MLPAIVDGGRAADVADTNESEPAQPSFYRQEAIDAASAPARLDRTVQVTPARLWLVLVAAILAAAGFVIWWYLGQTPTEIDGPGILVFREGSLGEVIADTEGVVTSLEVGVGDAVAEGDIVATVRAADGSEAQVTSLVHGDVGEVGVTLGSFVVPGSPIVELLDPDSPLEAVVSIAQSDVEEITVGDRALISPSTAPAEQYGSIEGTVTAIAIVPLGAERARLLAGGHVETADALLEAGPRVEVRVQLARDPSTPSGLSWSRGDGPDFRIRSTTTIDARILPGDSAVALLNSR